uniref:PGG domain-containing protein n=1 Tax=Fagus sylvatica TaxID=28930 RepID=A0A2N9HL19_FAGSY
MEGSSEGPSSAYDHKKLFQMKNHIGNTALHEAVRTGQSNEVIMYLLSVNPEALYSLNNESFPHMEKGKVIDVKLRNNKGLNAVDIVVKQRIIDSLGLGISWKYPWMKTERKFARVILGNKMESWNISTMLSVIGVLVATVSFTAGLTVPGGFNSSDMDLQAKAWQPWQISGCSSREQNSLALVFSSALGALPPWLSPHTSLFSGWFPFWDPHPVCRCISYYAIPYMLQFTDKQEESQSANKSPSYLALCVRCMNEMTEIRIAERMKNVEASKSKDKQEESQSANKFPNYLALCVGCMNEMIEMRSLRG